MAGADEPATLSGLCQAIEIEIAIVRGIESQLNEGRGVRDRRQRKVSGSAVVKGHQISVRRRRQHAYPIGREAFCRRRTYSKGTFPCVKSSDPVLRYIARSGSILQCISREDQRSGWIELSAEDKES